MFLCLEAVLVLYATTTPLTLLTSHRAVRAWLERWRPLPDPFAAAALLLRLLPQEGLVVSGRRYRALPISWEVSVPRFGRRRQPSPCPAPARMLLCDDAVLLDLRDACQVDGKVAHVHGKRLSYARDADPAAGRPRLAGARDWRAFRRDLPELLAKAAAHDPSGGHTAEWSGRPPGG